MKYCPQCGRSFPDGQLFCLDDGAQLSLRDPYHMVGRTLAGKYRLDALIGVGGMGAVYSAYHIALDRRVAFKILQPNLALGNPRATDLFEREARLAGRLVHENIVLVLDAGRASDDIAYIAMEWLEGRTLEAELAIRKQFDFGLASEILKQVAAALSAAHAERIVHRDLKPANIMLIQQAGGHPGVKVLDFGIGKALSETAGSPVSSVMGTPHYASPEQFRPQGRIDTRTDIYSLGVVLFQMLTGALPFDATSVHELVHLHLTAAPPPLRTLRPDAPAEIERLLDRMLAKEPDGRPARVSEIPTLFVDALNALVNRERENIQSERRQVEAPLPSSFEATERLTPPANSTADSPPLPYQIPLKARSESQPVPQNDGSPPAPELGAHSTPQLQSPSARKVPKRMLYAGIGGLFIIIAGMAITWRIITSDTSPRVGGNQPSPAPTGQEGAGSDQSSNQPITPNTSQFSVAPRVEYGVLTPTPAAGQAQQTINGRWIINSDETVVDTQTGLQWMKKDFRVLEGRFVRGWQDAMSWAKKMNDQRYAGHNNWQVPSISEYKSIRDKAVYPKIFESQGEDCYWSRNEISQWVASYIYMRGEYAGAAVSGDKNEGTNKAGVLFNGVFSVRLVRQTRR